jgi:hypothetical protein
VRHIPDQPGEALNSIELSAVGPDVLVTAGETTTKSLSDGSRGSEPEHPSEEEAIKCMSAGRPSLIEVVVP